MSKKKMKFSEFLNEVKLYRGGRLPEEKTLIWYTEDQDFATTYSHLKGDFEFHEFDIELSNLNICDIGRIENKTTMKYLCGILWKHSNISDEVIKRKAIKMMKDMSDDATADHLHQLIYKDHRFIDYMNLLNIDGIKATENKSVTYGLVKALLPSHK